MCEKRNLVHSQLFGATQYRRTGCCPRFNRFGGRTGLRYNLAYKNRQLQFKHNFEGRKIGRKITFKCCDFYKAMVYLNSAH